MFVLGRPGNDLLSRVLRHSTIGAEEFNGRVRDGIGFFSSSLKSPDRRRTNRQGSQWLHPELFIKLQVKGLSSSLNIPEPSGSARPTGRPCSCTDQPRERTFPPASEANVHTDMNHESNQANRAISTSQLNASPRLHTWPINVVVFHGSDREHSFRGGFPA